MLKEAIMSRNVGTIDRLIRVAIGAVLVALALAGVVGGWGYIGVLPLLTGAVGACPAYTLFGFGTCSKKT
jgi:hypothetical protein